MSAGLDAVAAAGLALPRTERRAWCRAFAEQRDEAGQRGERMLADLVHSVAVALAEADDHERAVLAALEP